jgi:streptogramin lyase
VLGRLEGDAWTTWGEQAVGEFDANLPVGYVAAPDGALWIAEKVLTFGQFKPPVTCQGVARFDGTRLERFLENLCIRFIDVGPDGSAWLLADEPDTLAPPDPVHLYVITREPK